MTIHQFEHPLNEKTRIYLRVEALLAQLHRASQFDDGDQYQLFSGHYLTCLIFLNKFSFAVNWQKISKNSVSCTEIG